MEQESKKAVITALLANVAIAVFKITAALISRSSSMMAEGYHSVSDSFNQVLLLIGLRRGRRPPDEDHPFGHGKEQYFWSFMVAVLLFGVAGLFSVWEGFHKWKHPEPLNRLWLNYAAIAFAFIFETSAFRMAYRSLKQEMDAEKRSGIFDALRKSKDPVTLTVLVEDSLAMAGLAIAALAITLVKITGILLFDAGASILIGLLLMSFALFLAFETRKLLLGESATESKCLNIRKALAVFPEIEKVISLRTMHLSSEEVLVALEIDYRDEVTVKDLEVLNDRIEAAIRRIIPRAKVYLEAENKPSQ